MNRRSKRIVSSVAGIVALLFVVLAGGGLYLTSYALQPDGGAKDFRASDLKGSWDYLYREYPYVGQWVDSLQQVINRTEREMQSYLTNADYCFLIYHPALSYFARDYSLQQISIEEGGKEPSPSHLQELMKTCKQKQVRVVFVQQEFDQRNAEVIAQELGLKIVPINPLSYDWNKEMIHIAKSLSKKQ